MRGVGIFEEGPKKIFVAKGAERDHEKFAPKTTEKSNYLYWPKEGNGQKVYEGVWSMTKLPVIFSPIMP